MSRWPSFLLLLVLTIRILPAAAGEPLGRLILTPAERQTLDRQRRSNPAYHPVGEGGERNWRVVGELRSSKGRQRRWHDVGSGAAMEAAGLPPLPVGDRLHPASGRHDRLWGDGGLRPGRREASGGRH